MLVDPLALSKEAPLLSAKTPIVAGQKALFIAGSVLLVLLSAWRPWSTVKGFILLSTVFYLLFTVYKFLLVRFSVSGGAEIRIREDEASALPEGSLPVYSILVPMYREPESVAQSVEALKALDYPPEKKDVQLLLEEDDESETCSSSVFSPPLVVP